jgi:pimeloyl-ACP methyl ester carboxylesterase
VVNYDRRGRGDSGDTSPYATDREVDDLAALVAEVGGEAAVYGHSSGAALAVLAAAAGVPVTRLVLHEPPYSGDDEASTSEARALADAVRTALAEDRRGDAIGLFLADMGLPDEALAAMCTDPAMLAVAPTMAYDFAVMGDVDGRTSAVPADLVRSIDAPTMVLIGSASPPFFREAGDRLLDLLPDGRLEVLDGQDHGAGADVVAPVVADFTVG